MSNANNQRGRKPQRVNQASLTNTTFRLVPPATLRRPHVGNTLSEIRAIAEICVFALARKSLQNKVPKGDGHPVMVIPGFMAGDAFTRSLRRFLTALGYDSHPWDQGRNQGLRDETCSNIERKIAEIYRTSGRKISLIGHSLGGVYVRAIAHRQPQHVRQIITLGSPFNASFEQRDPDSRRGALARAYDRFNAGAENDELSRSQLRHSPPPLPSTSVYSKGDGIIGWQHCVDIANGQTENIGVAGSHTGMAHNPMVLYLIANRLAQKEQEWEPFKPAGLEKLMLKPSCATELFPEWPRQKMSSD